MATDEDLGFNGEVHFRIVNDTVGKQNMFAINSSSGILTLAQNLDREKRKRHQVC